jgi:hydroxyacylglutathione hydrolase
VNPNEIVAAISGGAVVLDMRRPGTFVEAHVAGAINLQFNRADLAERAEMLLPQEKRYVLVAEPDLIARTAGELLGDAGFNVDGYLVGGMAAWVGEGLPTASLRTLTVDELHEHGDELAVIDVRESYEFNHARIPDSSNHPSMQPWASHVSLPDGGLAIVCADETRSAFIASVASSIGRDARLVRGGMTAWLDRGFPIEGRLAEPQAGI